MSLGTCLDSLRAGAVFGWRQLKKKKVTSAAAILSLALAIGACASAAARIPRQQHPRADSAEPVAHRSRAPVGDAGAVRLAIGVQTAGIARLVTVDVFSMMLAGALAGFTLGMASVRYLVPAVIHAVRLDPVAILRAE